MFLKSIPRDARVIIIGDVHGCLTELKALIEKLHIRHERDALIFVGDLVNKGPASCEVIDYVRALGAISVRGNHDDAAIRDYKGLSRHREPRGKLVWVKEMTPDQASYLEAMPFSVSLPDLNLIVVHAGMVPDVPLEKQDLRDLYRMRFLLKIEGKWTGLESFEDGAQQWAHQWQGPQHVVFGHDAVRRLQRCKYATGLDTGCVYGGELAACVIPVGSILHQRRCARAPLDATAENLQIEIVTVPGWAQGN